MAAHVLLKAAEDDLGKLIKSVTRLIRHKGHFSRELNTIKSRLDELQPVVRDLKATIESFKFRLSIKEVGDFQKKLKDHINLCENFSGESDSLKDSKYTKQVDELDKSLKEQLDILTGQNPNPQEGTGGMVTRVIGRVENLIHINGPEETGVTARFRNICGRVLEPLIHNDGPEKHSTKALFKDLCSRVETLLTTKVHFKKELGNTKSWLDELQPLQVNYIQVIEERNVSLNFWIKEVEDYKKELSKGIKLCEDFSREDNSAHKSASADPLYQLNRDLKKQFEVLTAKKRKGRTLTLRFW